MEDGTSVTGTCFGATVNVTGEVGELGAISKSIEAACPGDRKNGKSVSVMYTRACASTTDTGVYTEIGFFF